MKNQPSAMPEHIDETENAVQRSNSRYCFWRFLSSLIIWIPCITILLSFSLNIFNEYGSKNPITITTYINAPEEPDPIVIKICNTVSFDPDKILDYNRTQIDPLSYQFLLQTVHKNLSYDERKFVIPFPITKYFLLSNKTFAQFSLDRESFIFGCHLIVKDCLNHFKWFLQPEGVCYRQKVSLQGYGVFNMIHMKMYFDPHLKFGKYTEQTGAYISVTHYEDDIPFSNYFFLGAGQKAIVSAETTHQIQKTSFQQSKCIHQKGPETHYFTGVPFEKSYHVHDCFDICFAKSFRRKCNCSSLIGSVVTDTECLDDVNKRDCLFAQSRNLGALFDTEHKTCIASCVKKCDQKILENKISIGNFNYGENTAEFMIRDLNRTKHLSTRLSKVWHDMSDNNFTDEFVRKFTQNVAELMVYMQPGQQIKRMETILLMSGSTFVSNIGGLVGMWLGLSAVSVLELMENFIHKSFTYGMKLTNVKTTASGKVEAMQ